MANNAQTLFDKIWEQHLVKKGDSADLIYIDHQLIHEVTSPQAFEGLRMSGRKVRRPDAQLAVADHNVPTTGRDSGIKDEISKIQVETLENNCKEFGVEYLNLDDVRQGVVHIVGPEQGFTHPGMTIVCGDSHTSTHGAFGALAFGIGTSEVEHVLATQTLLQKPAKNMKVDIVGNLPLGITAKDVALAVIGRIGTAGGTGYVIEYTGQAVRDLTIEGRMTLCNMSIEAGARAGLIAADEKTFAYLKGKPRVPNGDEFDKAVEYWKQFVSDENAEYDEVITIDVSDIEPQVTWGTSPEDVLPISAVIPDPNDEANESAVISKKRAIEYMGIEVGKALKDITIDTIFIGSCTNGRIEDLREAAKILEDKKIADNIQRALVVPGSGLVKEQAESEGLDKIFIQAGFEWRDAGCSMCLAMNDDKLTQGERCASTSNRNFEGRQGRGGRTHLVSPAMAAAAAVNGKLSDVRDFI